jgi:hypothetical protein
MGEGNPREHFCEWIAHAEGCPYSGIDDDTVPCGCPVLSAHFHDPPCENTECELCWHWRRPSGAHGYA